MKNLKPIREKAGVSQKLLAEALGVDENTVWRWEAGRVNPSVEMGRQLADFFNVSVDTLLNGPKPNELKINIIWEVTEEMNELTIKPNEFSIGLRSDGQYLLYGALPASMSVDEIIERIRKELAFAEKMRKMREHGGD